MHVQRYNISFDFFFSIFKGKYIVLKINQDCKWQRLQKCITNID